MGITAIVHLCRAVRNEDDSVNFGIATGVLGAAIGANRRSAKLAILCASVFSVAGGLADYGLRQVMSRGENVHDLHSSIDYRRFEKKSHAGGEH